MALNEYQKYWLKASGLGEQIEFLEGRPDISKIMVPMTPAAQAFKHQLGGAGHALDVVRELQRGNVAEAQTYVEQLRQQARESSRGVAKDALPMLQAQGIIEELFEGPAKPISQELLAQAFQALNQQQKEGLAGWAHEQNDFKIT